jgi:hypothetical protein
MFLIIILIIVLVYIALQQRVEGFKTDKKRMDKKALICYYGGAFREGEIGSTKNDSKYGYDAQKNTSITHAKLKQLLNDKGYQTDILISTRNTKYGNQLDSWYKPYDMIINKISEKMHGKDYMIQSTVENINKLNKYDYDFILFVRIDLFLKPDFFEVLDTETNKISFLANNYNPKNCENYVYGSPEVVDLFLLVPKKYYYILDKKFNLNHNSWSYYKKTYKLSDNDMTFMSDIMFDSNSSIDINPYYLMSSRKENTSLHLNKKFKLGERGNKKCKGYKQSDQKYLDNPTDYYLNKYSSFYN